MNGPQRGTNEPRRPKENRTMTSQPYTIRVTFYVFCNVLQKEFRNVELHRSMSDARLRASALNWQIEKVESL
jgi:hypothetical protein